MKALRFFLPGLAVTGLLFGCNPEKQPGSAAETTPAYSFDESIRLPEAFRAAVVADSVGRARHIAVHDNGDIYVQLNRLKNGKGLVALRDTNGDARADLIRYFGDHTGTGIRLYKGSLYCSSDEAVFRYPLEAGSLTPDETDKVLIAGGFPEQNQHESKSFAFDDAGHLYVNVGAPSNACMEQTRTAGSKGMDPCPQLERQAGIWQFDAERPAQTQLKDGRRYATGIRNTVGLAWNFSTGNLFLLQHGRDQLHQFWPDRYTKEQSADLPAEEFLSVQDGDDFGWPFCYFDPFQDKKLLAPEYGGDGRQQGRCAGIKRPLIGFPAHMAPNDLLFYTGTQFPEKYRNGAFITFHGSWNRDDLGQKGYFVVFVPMKGGLPDGEWEIFAEGFAGIDPIPSPSDARHRPMGLAQGPDGALYITDSVKGKIWKIIYQG